VGRDTTGTRRVESNQAREQKGAETTNGGEGYFGLHGCGAWILGVSLAAVWSICAGKWS
jgi:hypothetical protein